MSKKILVGFLVIIAVIAQAQNVAIPDANFKAALVGNGSINTNGDNEIQQTEAQAFTGTIDVAAQSIGDLAGIEAFVALDKLYCSNNQLTALNIAANTALTILDCASNQLTTLNVNNNTALRELYVKNNVNLSALDVSHNTALRILHCYNNDLATLDVGQNTLLRTLYCFGNNLTTLDVRNNAALFSLHCYANQLSSVQLRPGNRLSVFRCEWNQLSSLDLSNNSGIRTLTCQGNQLTALNVQNGTSTQIHGFNFDASNNPNLTCIQVDDVNYSMTTWTNVDSTASFSTNCTITGLKGATNLPTMAVFPNPTQEELSVQLDQLYSQIDLEIINPLGQIIQKEQFKNCQTIKTHIVGRSGLYWLHLRAADKTTSLKIIKN